MSIYYINHVILSRPVAGWHNVEHLMETGIPETNETNDSQPNIVPIEMRAAKVLAKGHGELWGKDCREIAKICKDWFRTLLLLRKW